MMPASQARFTSSRILSSFSITRLLWPVKQWVRTSPGFIRLRISRRGGRCDPDVDHDWQAEGVRGQARSVHRHRTIVADRVGVEAYLDSDDNVAILRRGLHRSEEHTSELQ